VTQDDLVTLGDQGPEMQAITIDIAFQTNRLPGIDRRRESGVQRDKPAGIPVAKRTGEQVPNGAVGTQPMQDWPLEPGCASGVRIDVQRIEVPI
jgi:hypothetical protein